MTTRKGHGNLDNGIPFKKPKLQVNIAVPSSMWGDDSDEDDLILLASQAVEQNNTPTNFNSFMQEFEKDARTSTQHGSESENPSALSVNIKMRAKMTAVNQNKASQDFLRKRIESLERDNQRVNEDRQSAVESVQIKNYEVSALKHELKELQKANSELRLKLVNNDQHNKEVLRNKTLERQLLKSEAELELKSLELIKLKSDRRMSSQMPEVTTSPVDAPEKNDHLIEIPLSQYGFSKLDSWQFRLGHRIFENVVDDVGMETAMFGEQLAVLQRSMGLLFAGQSINVDNFVGHTRTAMDLALYIISAKCDSSVQHGRRQIILSDPIERAGVCIYDKDSMFDDEELITFRRILSIFALVCKLTPKFGVAFLESSLCEILLNILRALSRTDEEYQIRTLGIIQASAVLLLNLVEGGCTDPGRISPLFKALCFARLDSFALYIMIKVLTVLDIEVSRKFLCINNEKKAFVIDSTHNVAQFSKDSCLLQVLTTSIECAFPATASASYWTPYRYQKLLILTRSLMRFFRKSMIGINSEGLSMDRPCLCYLKLTTSFVVLVHLCLHLMQTIPVHAEMRQISVVSQLATLLLHDIFSSNRQSMLMNSMGRSIKNRLIVVYNRLLDFNKIIHFRLAQVKALHGFEVDLLTKLFVKPAGDGKVNDIQQREEGDLIWGSISI